MKNLKTLFALFLTTVSLYCADTPTVVSRDIDFQWDCINTTEWHGEALQSNEIVYFKLTLPNGEIRKFCFVEYGKRVKFTFDWRPYVIERYSDGSIKIYPYTRSVERLSNRALVNMGGIARVVPVD